MRAADGFLTWKGADGFLIWISISWCLAISGEDQLIH